MPAQIWHRLWEDLSVRSRHVSVPVSGHIGLTPSTTGGSWIPRGSLRRQEFLLSAPSKREDCVD